MTRSRNLLQNLSTAILTGALASEGKLKDTAIVVSLGFAALCGCFMLIGCSTRKERLQRAELAQKFRIDFLEEQKRLQSNQEDSQSFEVDIEIKGEPPLSTPLLSPTHR